MDVCYFYLNYSIGVTSIFLVVGLMNVKSVGLCLVRIELILPKIIGISYLMARLTLPTQLPPDISKPHKLKTNNIR
jgi:hypothetical protein